MSVKKLENKVVTLSRNSILFFRLKNPTFSARKVNFTLKRIPAKTETENFNTSVTWIEKRDSTFRDSTETYIAKVDTVFEQILDKRERVHSKSNMNYSNKGDLKFTLPPDSKAWAFGINTSKSANIFAEAQDVFRKTKASSMMASGGLMGGIIFDIGLGYFANAQPGQENIRFKIYSPSGQNISYGNVSYEKNKFKEVFPGQYVITLENDNTFNAIDVDLKITSVKFIEHKQTKKHKVWIVKSKMVPTFTT